jgi:predicted RNase H-like HicB family nuclease
MPTKDLAYYMGLKYPAEIREGASGGYFVTNPDLDGCMAEGETPDEALAHLADSRELWIESRLTAGRPVPEPSIEESSGTISLRMAPSLHAQLAKSAARQNISLNLLINTALAEYAGGARHEGAINTAIESLRRVTEELKAGSVGLGHSWQADISATRSRRRTPDRGSKKASR